VSKPLEECAVVITGGTSGVGLATAHAFAEVGVTRLALIGRNHARGMAAIVMFSRTLAIEAKRDGIRVNAITPSRRNFSEQPRRWRIGGPPSRKTWPR